MRYFNSPKKNEHKKLKLGLVTSILKDADK